MISGLGAVQVLTSSRTYKDDKDKYKIIVKELRSWLEESKKIAVAQEHRGSINAINLVLDKLNELEGVNNDK